MIKNNLLSKNIRYIAILIVVLGLFIYPRIPYINLYATYSIEFTLWIFIILFFKFKAMPIYIVSLFFIVIMAILTLVGMNALADQISTSTFLMLVTSVVIMVKENVKKNERSR